MNNQVWSDEACLTVLTEQNFQAPSSISAESLRTGVPTLQKSSGLCSQRGVSWKTCCREDYLDLREKGSKKRMEKVHLNEEIQICTFIQYA